MSDPNAHRFKLLRIYCEASSVATVGMGCLVLYGWAFHIEMLKTVLPGLVTMKANTALGIAFSGASLWLLLPADSGTKRKNVARFLALLVVMIGTATLAEYVFGTNLGIDQLLFNDPEGSVGTSSPGRLTPTTATAFMALGLALMLLDYKTRRGRRPSGLSGGFARRRSDAAKDKGGQGSGISGISHPGERWFSQKHLGD